MRQGAPRPARLPGAEERRLASQLFEHCRRAQGRVVVVRSVEILTRVWGFYTGSVGVVWELYKVLSTIGQYMYYMNELLVKFGFAYPYPYQYRYLLPVGRLDRLLVDRALAKGLRCSSCSER